MNLVLKVPVTSLKRLLSWTLRALLKAYLIHGLGKLAASSEAIKRYPSPVKLKKLLDAIVITVCSVQNHNLEKLRKSTSLLGGPG